MNSNCIYKLILESWEEIISAEKLDYLDSDQKRFEKILACKFLIDQYIKKIEEEIFKK